MILTQRPVGYMHETSEQSKYLTYCLETLSDTRDDKSGKSDISISRMIKSRLEIVSHESLEVYTFMKTKRRAQKSQNEAIVLLSKLLEIEICKRSHKRPITSTHIDPYLLVMLCTIQSVNIRSFLFSTRKSVHPVSSLFSPCLLRRDD